MSSAFGSAFHYEDLLGHRGFTHSLSFAALLAGILVLAGVRLGVSGPSSHAGRAFAFFFLVTASHGFLDAMTDGGLGVAFFSPFSNTRYFLPWRPVQVSPIGLSRFFTARGWAVLRSELLWIWIPSGILVGVAWGIRRSRPVMAVPD